MQKIAVSGNIVNIRKKEIYPGTLTVQQGKIISITNLREAPDLTILPGFIDAHVHIESSMMVPSEFARAAIRHGTIASVSDPHEIANVLGVKGIEYMIENGKQSPFKFFFGAPSCVPATGFETAGGRIGTDEIEELMGRKDIYYLSEVMNYPGVINRDQEYMEKIKSAIRHRKKIDGHAPGLTGEELQAYIKAGISTDHECVTEAEANEKIERGMKILIREGSAAKNLDELLPLVERYPDRVMLCTDDIHPDDLLKGHINKLVKYGIDRGVDKFKMIAAATKNPAEHYGLNVGMLQAGDPADFIIIDSLSNFKVLATYINGIKLYDGERVLTSPSQIEGINHFNAARISPGDLAVPARSNRINVIKAEDGSLITDSIIMGIREENGYIMTDPEKDILKLVVQDRYSGRPPELGFVRGFGLKKGAIASSIAHDSHNIIAVGTNDEDLCLAINKVIACNGALVVSEGRVLDHLPLPVAGLMSDKDIDFVARKYAGLGKKVSSLGTSLTSAFMTLSFMALLVIPKLKLSDRGLFDSEHFQFTSLQL